MDAKMNWLTAGLVCATIFLVLVSYALDLAWLWAIIALDGSLAIWNTKTVMERYGV
jgi:hypothetical protein